jgi:hypothetical protein
MKKIKKNRSLEIHRIFPEAEAHLIDDLLCFNPLMISSRPSRLPYD